MNSKIETINSTKNNSERMKPKIDVIHSVEKEVERVKSTIKKLDWYKEHGYKVRLPEGLTSESSEKEIREAVASEYDTIDYEEASGNINNQWGEIAEKISALMDPPISFESEYNIQLTRYGVGGSYNLPNKIILSIRNTKDRIIKVIVHEMIHLAIQPLINKYDISQWNKERLVDLLYKKLFPEIAIEQEKAKEKIEVDKIFNKYYPDIEGCIKRCGKLE